jgi:hypothetical protein
MNRETGLCVRWWRLVYAVLLLMAVHTPSFSAGNLLGDVLLEPKPTATTTKLALDTSRSRLQSLDWVEKFRLTTLAVEPLSSNQCTIELFQGLSVRATLVRIEDGTDGAKSWIGKTDEVSFPNVIITYRGASATGTIDLAGVVYRLWSGPDGICAVVKTRPTSRRIVY